MTLTQVVIPQLKYLAILMKFGTRNKWSIRIDIHCLGFVQIWSKHPLLQLNLKKLSDQGSSIEEGIATKLII